MLEIQSKLNNLKLAGKKLGKTSQVKSENQVPKEGIIKGEVVDVKGLAVKILTDKGKMLTGQMQDAEILNKGEQKAFEVLRENGQTILKPIKYSPQQQKEMQIKSALKELGILNSQFDEAVAKELMENGLPVNKKMLNDLGRLLKLFKAQDMVGQNKEVNENAKNANTQNTTNTLNVADTEEEQQTVKGQNRLNLGNASGVVNKGITKQNVDKSVFMLKNEIPISSKNTDLVTQFSNKEVNIQKDLTNIQDGVKQLSDQELKSNLENIIKFGDKEGVTEKNILSKTNINNLQQLLKDDNAKEGVLKLLKGEINIKTGEQFKATDLAELTKPELKEVMENVDKKELANLVKGTRRELDFSFKMSQGTIDEVDDFFEEITDKFDKLLKELSERKDEQGKELFEKLSNAKDKMDFSNHIKNNVFLQLPFNINDHKTNGELTIFKDKRKKGTSGVSSALIALDTKSLGLFETFIQKSQNNLNLQFRLENKEVEELVKMHMPSLKDTLTALNYKIDNVNFKTEEQSFTILDDENKLKDIGLKVNEGNTNFEAKA